MPTGSREPAINAAMSRVQHRQCLASGPTQRPIWVDLCDWANAGCPPGSWTVSGGGGNASRRQPSFNGPAIAVNQIFPSLSADREILNRHGINARNGDHFIFQLR